MQNATGLKRCIRTGRRGITGDLISANGSGSLEQDGQLCIIAMKKEKQTGLVHDLRLGKR